MRLPRWMDASAHAPVALGTFLSFAAAPLGGLGALTLLFGGIRVGTVMAGAGAGFWFAGRALLRR